MSTTTDRQPRQPWVTVSVACLVVAAACLVVAVAAKTGLLGAGSTGTGSETAAVPSAGPSAGAASGAAEANTTDHRRPECPVTTLAGTDFDCLGHPGQSAQPDADAKRPIVVPVWAWWCGPCKKELPHIAEFAAGTTDYTVVGLQADPNAAAGISLLNDKGVDLPSLIDKDGSLQKTTGMPGLVPLVAVFDPAGEFIGYTATAIGSPADIEAAVNKVLESP